MIICKSTDLLKEADYSEELPVADLIFGFFNESWFVSVIADNVFVSTVSVFACLVAVLLTGRDANDNRVPIT